MAAAFETRVLENGVWVTRTAGIPAAIGALAEPVFDDESISDPPECALLSTTILESPQVNKILHVHVRSKARTDIAFIGSYAVTIRELLDNGQTRDILKHHSFGQRIRNAVVVGELKESVLLEAEPPGEGHADTDHINLDNLGSPWDPSTPSKPPFPPQMLVLILERGDLMSLYFVGGEPVIRKIAQTHHPIPYLGHYMAVDPQCRYMVAAGFEDSMCVYEVESWPTLRQRYEATGLIGQVIRSIEYHPIRSTILDVQFLHPRAQDDTHIILMALTCSKSREGRSEAKQKYTIWDWVVGDPLSEGLKSSQRVPITTNGIPLFCIPLRAQYAFYIVCEEDIALVQQPLSGGASPDTIWHSPEKTTLHHGKNKPLWAAWARAFRREDWLSGMRDAIYLAREDGQVQLLEIEPTTLMASFHEISEGGPDGVGVNVGTAFATSYTKSEDVLIVGGDSGPGGIWRIGARAEPAKTRTIDNWAPVLDMTTTSNALSWDDAVKAAEKEEMLARGTLKLDRTFFASGRGKTGCVVEPHYGVKARIGLELNLGDTAKDVWLFPDSSSQDGSMNLLLALPHSTQVLHLSHGFDDAAVESSDTTPFDLTSRTIHASSVGSERVVQVTERTINLITPSQRSRHFLGDILGRQDASSLAEKASVRDDHVVVSTLGSEGPELHILRIDQMDVRLISTRSIAEEVTCLEIIRVADFHLVAVGLADIQGPLLWVCPLQDAPGISQACLQRIDVNDSSAESLEALVSISVAHEGLDSACVVAGTRCGHLLTITAKIDETIHLTWEAERLGLGPVGVFPGTPRHIDGAFMFATCDDKLTRLSRLGVAGMACYQKRETVLAVNLEEPSMMPPPIHAVYATKSTPGVEPLHILLSGTQLFFTELDAHEGPVARVLPLGRTPTRLIFSKIWKCLVVALITPDDRGVELAFIDTEAGLDPGTNTWSLASKPLNADGKEGPLTAFDTPGDRVLVLREWVYLKEGKSFAFIIVGLKSGKLVVVSVNPNKEVDQDPSHRRLTHSQRMRWKNLPGPVTAVATDEMGFLCCSGKTLRRYVLEDKKLKAEKELELSSPALSLEIHDGKAYVLTASHSLEVVDYQSEHDEEMAVIHYDGVTRSGLHMIGSGPAEDPGLWPISLVADSHSQVTGLWVPKGHSHQAIQSVFSGRLSSPIRKFVRAHCQTQQTWGLLSTADEAEILGVSLDGAMTHFRLLKHDLWEVLINMQSLIVTRSGPKAWHVPRRDDYHINGDILAWCLEERPLEACEPPEADTRSNLENALCRLEGGIFKDRMLSEMDCELTWPQTCTLCYAILEDLLSPVI